MNNATPVTQSVAQSEALRTIVIMAGGTGGHIFPALAVAKALQTVGCPVVWIGTPNSMEAKLVPQHNVPIRYINIKALRGKGIKAKALLPFRLIKAVTQALNILRDVNPAAVLGMGGFVTGPGGIAAFLLRRPLMVHEQNAVAGMTNRYLSKVASNVYEAFPESFGADTNSGKKALCVGNPIRAEIANLHKEVKNLNINERKLHLLIVGGSLGALALNNNVPIAIAKLFKESKLESNNIQIRHQTGEKTFTQATEAYANAKVDAEVIKFIDDMAAAYRWADVIICRAGALTVSEVSAAGVPAIFVPFPHAVDDHQTRNAESLALHEAAIIISQDELSAESLGNALLELVQDNENLVKMSQQAKVLAKLDATKIISEQCLAYAKVKAKVAA